MSLGTDRVEQFIFDQIEVPEETLQGVDPKKIEEVNLRRQFGTKGKPTTVFPPNSYPDRESLSRIE
jgi:hypothetical protein